MTPFARSLARTDPLALPTTFTDHSHLTHPPYQPPVSQPSPALPWIPRQITSQASSGDHLDNLSPVPAPSSFLFFSVNPNDKHRPSCRTSRLSVKRSVIQVGLRVESRPGWIRSDQGRKGERWGVVGGSLVLARLLEDESTDDGQWMDGRMDGYGDEHQQFQQTRGQDLTRREGTRIRQASPSGSPMGSIRHAFAGRPSSFWPE